MAPFIEGRNYWVHQGGVEFGPGLLMNKLHSRNSSYQNTVSKNHKNFLYQDIKF